MLQKNLAWFKEKFMIGRIVCKLQKYARLSDRSSNQDYEQLLLKPSLFLVFVRNWINAFTWSRVHISMHQFLMNVDDLLTKNIEVVFLWKQLLFVFWLKSNWNPNFWVISYPKIDIFCQIVRIMIASNSSIIRAVWYLKKL